MIVITVPRKIVDYCVIEADQVFTNIYVGQLISTSTGHALMLTNGWEPFGGPTAMIDWSSGLDGLKETKLYQAWVRYEEEEKK